MTARVIINAKLLLRPKATSRLVPRPLFTAQSLRLSSPYCCKLFDHSIQPVAHLSLMFLSGLPTAEKPAAKKQFLASHKPSSSNTFSQSPPTNDSWAEYKDYLSKTSVILPIPPALYKPLPEWLKRSVLLDFPMYRFEEEKDGKEALEEERKKHEREV